MYFYLYPLLVSLFVLSTYIALGQESGGLPPAKSADTEDGSGRSTQLDQARDESLDLQLDLADITEPVVAEEGVPEQNVLPDIQGAGQRRVSGVIYDSMSGRGLAGVNVSIPMLDLFTRTDAGGKYQIEGLREGSYNLSIVKIGYTAINDVIRVKAKEDLQFSRELVQKPIEADNSTHMMEEYDVVAEYVEEEEFSIGLDAAETGGLVSGIGKAEFSRAGVSDAAGAVSKISGANIVGGKFAVVRGLGDRYSNTTLNGALVPSADPSRKAVQLDLFPADLLQSVKIYKTARPELTAEFTGGLVELQTLQIPDERKIEFSLGTKYSSNLAEADEFLRIRDRDLSFFGDNNDDALEQYYHGQNNFGSARSGSRGSASNAEATDYILDSVPLAARSSSANELPTELSAMFADSIELGSESRLGMVLSFTHAEQDQYRESFKSRSSTVSGGISESRFNDSLPGFFDSSYVDSTTGTYYGAGVNSFRNEKKYSTSVDWGFLGGLTYEINDRHQIGYTYFRNRSAVDEITVTDDFLRANSEITQEQVLTGRALSPLDSSLYVEEYLYTSDTTYRDLEVQQFTGEHQLDFFNKGFDFDWALSSTDALEERPRSTRFLLRKYTPVDGSSDPVLSTLEISATPTTTSIDSTRTEEEAVYSSANLGFDLFGDSKAGAEAPKYLRFKSGITAYDRDRTNSGIALGIRPESVDTVEDGWEDVLELINNTVVTTGSTTTSATASNNSLSSTTYNAEGGSELEAYYFQLEAEYNGWTVVGGSRFENERRFYDIDLAGNALAIRNGEDAQGEDSNQYWFPSLYLSKKFGHSHTHQIDFAWSKSIARPIFSEFAPVNSYDPVEGEILVGNSDLQDSLTTNFDLKWSWFPKESFSMSVGAFHKVINDPIIKVDGSISDSLTYVNFPEANVDGLELELYKDLGGSFYVTTNLSYIKADITSLESETNIYEVDSLLGQADWLANVILTYDDEYSGVSASLVYNFTDQYTERVVNQYTLDPLLNPTTGNVIRKPMHTLDFILAKRFSLFDDRDAKVAFKVRNLLNSKTEYVYDGNDLPAYESYEDGRSYSLSLDVSF
ncbi:MAG: outer membrane beta-barrel protein [Akkermansiaceae bacterium]